MNNLLSEIKKCTVCKDFLPNGCNPITTGSPKSKVIIIGQAPGKRVHESSIPWNDPSGDNLRRWLNVDKETFYNTDIFSLMPMGFCYPGTGKSGDLPPRKECAPLWHDKMLEAMPEVELIILVGLYAQKYYLKSSAEKNLTETVRRFENYLPKFLPLPHPSPRNNIWMKKNEWFAKDILPLLKVRISKMVDIK